MDPDARRLKAAGLRVTQARLATLRVAEAAQAVEGERHLSVATLLERVRRELPGTSVQTMYDCVDALSAARLLRRVQVGGEPARYEADHGDNHHHLVCRSCGTTLDVPCSTGTAPCLAPAADHGFAVDEAEVVFWGRCPACAADAAATHPHHLPAPPTTERTP